MLVRFNFDTDYLGTEDEEVFEYEDGTSSDKIMDDLEAWKDNRVSCWAEIVDEDGEVIGDV
ncbi:MAG: hypothetical protein L0L22_07720 [Staphylococcus equorum]|nr:hypothetical protein [Lactococcus lactis]MDN6570870.1 hypothetical protein [Staphylococcus equorum]MDN6120258.1 hypothetical protein [Lactococcus lactis]MDN6504810.1 hypothetical protein [Lactococcus lactis]MDN6587749.1 hypothetical protein [Lactococcus lactis]